MTETEAGLDLIIERRVEAPRDMLWRAWKEPELLAKWWCPKPWEAVITGFDLRPGGALR